MTESVDDNDYNLSRKGVEVKHFVRISNKDLEWDSHLASSLGLNRIKTRSGPLSGGPLNSILEDSIHTDYSKQLDNHDANRPHLKKKVLERHIGKSVRTKGYAIKRSIHGDNSDRLPEQSLDHVGGIVNGVANLPSKESCNFQSEKDIGGFSRMDTSSPISKHHTVVNKDRLRPSDSSSMGHQSSSFSKLDNQFSSSWLNLDSDIPRTSGDILQSETASEAETVRREYPMDQGSIGWYITHPEVNCINTTATGVQSPEVSCNQSEALKEANSPRFQALLRMTTGPHKAKPPNQLKSFSHELDPRGVCSHLYWRPQNSKDVEAALKALRARFDTAKEEVNAELAVFAGNLVEILEKHGEAAPDWKEKIEDLLILARQCAVMSPSEFRHQGENIVQDLDDRRQELPVGLLKQLHTRMLFILTRCTRLLQFQKETGLDEDYHNNNVSARMKVESPLDRAPTSTASRKGKVGAGTSKDKKTRSPPRFYSQELRGYNWKGKELVVSSQRVHPEDGDQQDKRILVESTVLHRRVDPLNSCGVPRKKLPTAPEHIAIGHGISEPFKRNVSERQLELHKENNLFKSHLSQENGISVVQEVSLKKSAHTTFKPLQKPTSCYVGEQGGSVEEIKLVCRICEEVVPTLHLEEHSRFCAFADRCDYKVLGIDERLNRLAETLEKMVESCTPKSLQVGGGSPEICKQSTVKRGDGSEGVSPRLSELPRRGSEDMLEDLHEMDAASLEDLRGFGSNFSKTRFGPRSDLGLTASSTGSGTPCSPLVTPRTSQIDLLLVERCSSIDMEELVQMDELADIARCVANASITDEGTMEYLVSCMQDLQDVLQLWKFEALTVDTFGKRIQKLLREKYVQVCELLEQNSVGSPSNIQEEDSIFEEDSLHSLKSTPLHLAYKDRTSIDDFEIIKPISRGAFGRVFLARKRTTGDLFAIKVLRKADTIRKNAVESIQAERNILISARNPFMVRFFYSFTCRENLYLVMEYLNGGDLYSMLRNLGCLEEEMARVYIAELVLALEYLHSLGVVHRDLKPDNILIAHDGHIKLTDFGLSKVGLINSTDDLSGPAASGNLLTDENINSYPNGEYSKQREPRSRSAVGTPDYLAPEILLGTDHGYTADWWSVGVILFEFLVGIPPFNAEHPQIIFDNILNRKIPWPQVPEDLSYEAQDLIDRLLIEDPVQRLGAKDAAEVKAHIFFKDIKWDTLARQKAAFIPSPDTAHDTSYFTSRHRWSSTDGRVYAEEEFPDSSDYASSSGSRASISSRPEEGEECQDLADSENAPAAKYAFNNFSFKNLSQLASINYDLLLQSCKGSSKDL